MQNIVDFHGISALPESAPSIRPRQASSTRGTFTQKLIAKTTAVEKGLGGVLELMGESQNRSAHHWSVQSLFVTRNIEVSAFVSDPKVAFTSAERVVDVLRRGGALSPGWC
jgi:hypothetical protein